MNINNTNKRSDCKMGIINKNLKLMEFGSDTLRKFPRANITKLLKKKIFPNLLLRNGREMDKTRGSSRSYGTSRRFVRWSLERTLPDQGNDNAQDTREEAHKRGIVVRNHCGYPQQAKGKI